MVMKSLVRSLILSWELGFKQITDDRLSSLTLKEPSGVPEGSFLFIGIKFTGPATFQSLESSL